MKISSIYLGTWLPRTSIHLKEIYHFLKSGSGMDLDQRKLEHLKNQLNIKNLVFNNNQDFDSVKFSSENITVAITEDGIILVTLSPVSDINADIKKIESFYTNQLGPGLAYLFSRGAPLPRTLLNVKEIYPKILVGKSIAPKEAEEYLKDHGDEFLAKVSLDKFVIFYGQESELVDIWDTAAQKTDSGFLDLFFTYTIFMRSFSDLLERYLKLHRSVWIEISSIRENNSLRYSDFTGIRNKILDILKTISFIRARLQQMNDILSVRNAVAPEALKQKLSDLGLNNFLTLEKSSQYMDNLWQMTADYGNSTMTLFESLLEENAQREIRLLQQITIAGMLVGFFGMNIAFPWEDRWQNIFPSSFIVVGIIVLSLGIFYALVKKVIMNRHFVVASKHE